MIHTYKSVPFQTFLKHRFWQVVFLISNFQFPLLITFPHILLTTQLSAGKLEQSAITSLLGRRLQSPEIWNSPPTLQQAITKDTLLFLQGAITTPYPTKSPN